jgi:hypothetical protein
MGVESWHFLIPVVEVLGTIRVEKFLKEESVPSG